MIGFIAHFPAPTLVCAQHSPLRPDAATTHAAHAEAEQGDAETSCPHQQALDRYLPIAQAGLRAIYALMGMLLVAWVMIRLCITHPTAMMLLAVWFGLSLTMAGLWWWFRRGQP